jgi:phosphoribosylglycinamide formyltransferase-1
VHQVTAELDVGPILDQAVVPVLPGDTADTLAARVLTQEHLIYPRCARRWCRRFEPEQYSVLAIKNVAVRAGYKL